jgi:hypothetical protein
MEYTSFDVIELPVSEGNEGNEEPVNEGNEGAEGKPLPDVVNALIVGNDGNDMPLPLLPSFPGNELNTDDND